ncbi:MAG: glycoside hydrolase family 43 protein [Woeseiaceae bacterium]|nr:glycoside hydrolase family 43 protein [Woeseiaceae bacterium]NNL63610.1 glycoside hydrolase family 43 protein [Woeseiaceae bacterium]
MNAGRILAALVATAWLAACTTTPGPARPTFSNPVIPGFAPDPSIVRVGDDFWLINSTFEYFPGIPIYHSTDLVSWELVNYALTRPSQADLAALKSSDGIHASTIRFHDGTYYIITTNNVDGRMVNFVVTADDPRGEWSEARVLEGAPGIDPSLFFDDDGRAWYVGNWIPPDPEFPGQAEIWLQEVDIEAMRLVGERYFLWRGCCGGVWAEGPHIYKRDGWYYLLISEGGTSFDHAMAVAISNDITGPYLSNARNPVLTHRHLSYDYPISGVGHADLVELEDGRWYAVALGWRLVDGKYGVLGRETFLVPVTWEEEPYAWKEEKLTWPVFSPATGRVELAYPTPSGNTPNQSDYRFRDDFDTRERSPHWNFRRTPDTGFFEVDTASGHLRLRLLPTAVGERQQYAFAGIRQRHFEFEAQAALELRAAEGGAEAGMALIMNDRSALLFTLSRGGELRLLHNRDGAADELANVPYDGEHVQLRVVADYLDLGFYYSVDGKEWQTLAQGVDASVLAPERIGGYNYTGAYIGLYGSTNGAGTGSATFDYFEYQPTVSRPNDWFYREKTQ